MAPGVVPAALAGQALRGDAEWFEVTFDKVFVKKAPRSSAKSWGWVVAGQKIQVKPDRRVDQDGSQWVELTLFELWRSCEIDIEDDDGDHGRGFVLVDGSGVGLGQLLRGPLPPDEYAQQEAEIASLKTESAAVAKPAPPAATIFEPAAPMLAPRQLAVGLWRAAPLREPPGCSFFPRHGYVVLPLTGGSQVYVLGGERDARYYNDVWLLCLSAKGAAWTAVSAHQEPRRQVVGSSTTALSKWAGRDRFGAAVATVKPGRMALYVCGGRNGFGDLLDVWASDDSGANWYCMQLQPPFGRRVDPGLITVPGRYEQLVLCGGWTAEPGEFGLRLAGDVWVSDDAGMVWHEVVSPANWLPRGVPLMVFLPGNTAKGGRRLLVLGGTGHVFNGAGISDRMLSNSGLNDHALFDAWEADIDVQGAEATWRALGRLPDRLRAANGDFEDIRGEVPFCGRTAAFDFAALLALQPGVSDSQSGWREAGAIVAAADGELMTSLAPLPRSWKITGLLGAGRDAEALPAGIRGSFHCIALVSGPRVPCPRLFVFTTGGAFATTSREVRWHRHFLEWLGRRLDEAGRLPLEIWIDRVTPALLHTRRPAPARP